MALDSRASAAAVELARPNEEQSEVRTNLPITQREVKVPVGSTLLSTTDASSHITYANGAFVSISGFRPEELKGQPHNIVRHPDMPTEAFADMWRAIKAGLPWTALVKNRRKDGDHYWVRANATALRRGGAVVGYMSVRTGASDAEIHAADRLYAAIRDGRAGGRGLDRGLVAYTGWLRWRSAFQLMSVRARLGVGVVAAAGVSAAPLAAVGSPAQALVGVAAAIVGAALAMVFLNAQIVRPLQRTLKQSLAVASGESVEPVQLDRTDEIGLLLRSVNQSGLNLRALVDDVAEQVGGVDIASSEIAAGSQDLSARTERAASSLQQTAASMEQLTATIQSNVESARQVGDLAEQAREAARQGGIAMADAVERMREISASSQKISEIVGLIDSISFQTNILALNAAVEAARAGEQGRGFAVVAAEVRALAQRSAGAAREIKALIDGSAQTIQGGSKSVEAAGETVRLVVDKVDKVSSLMSDIAHVTAEQATGVSQVNTAVAGLDETTQQNSALVEQTAAAAESLRGQASRLAEAIGVYRGR